MPAPIKRKTEIFASYKLFMQRKDRTLNGVSPEFAEKYPDYEQQNESNMGCYNCIGCTRCRTCVECQFCDNCRSSCKNCSGCVDCKSCKNCVDCKSCKGCKNCKSSNNCIKCKDLKRCNNLINRKTLRLISSDAKAEIMERKYTERVRKNMMKLTYTAEINKNETYERIFTKEIKEIIKKRRKTPNRNKDIVLHMLIPVLRRKYPNISDKEMREVFKDLFQLMYIAFYQGGSILIENFGTFVINKRTVPLAKIQSPLLKQYVNFKMNWRQKEVLNKKYYLELKKYEKGIKVEPTNEFEIKDPLDI